MYCKLGPWYLHCFLALKPTPMEGEFNEILYCPDISEEEKSFVVNVTKYFFSLSLKKRQNNPDLVPVSDLVWRVRSEFSATTRSIITEYCYAEFRLC
jgi:hypothetical protein